MRFNHGTKITLNGQFHKSVVEVFEDFVISQTAQGLASGGLWGRIKTMEATDIEDGSWLFGNKGSSARAEVEGNIAKVTTSMYATVEVLGIQGTITIAE